MFLLRWFYSNLTVETWNWGSFERRTWNTKNMFTTFKIHFYVTLNVAVMGKNDGTGCKYMGFIHNHNPAPLKFLTLPPLTYIFDPPPPGRPPPYFLGWGSPPLNLTLRPGVMGLYFTGDRMAGGNFGILPWDEDECLGLVWHTWFSTFHSPLALFATNPRIPSLYTARCHLLIALVPFRLYFSRNSSATKEALGLPFWEEARKYKISFGVFLKR